ncbi:MAG: tetratricopeptide repeat protein [Desulfuromonadales bacterium]
MPDSFSSLLSKSEQALQNGDTLVALLQLEMAHTIRPLPGVKSKLAYCLAKERRQYQLAMTLCREALDAEPDNPDHYYQLSRIYMVAGRKRQAIMSLRKGLKFKRHQLIINELNLLGTRKSTVFAFLPREHFLNRGAGILLTKISLR